LHIIKRSDAITAGLNSYVSHNLCSRGHFSERRSSSGSCLDCARIWQEENKTPEKARKSKRYKDNREQIRSQQREYYLENKERIIEKVTSYQAENPGKVSAWMATRYIKHKDRIDSRNKEWRLNNPIARRAQAQKRRAISEGADGKFTAAEIKDLFLKQRGMCAICRKKLKQGGSEKFHIDHIQPISKGGSNWITNIQLACQPCNLKKNAKDPFEFAKQNGKLL
jgi:5-methylcytosine-specific restriction endonuclease McrA